MFENETAEERALRYTAWASLAVAAAGGSITAFELMRWKPEARMLGTLGGGFVGTLTGILAYTLLRPQLLVVEDSDTGRLVASVDPIRRVRLFGR